MNAFIHSFLKGPEEQTHTTMRMRRAELDDRDLAERPPRPKDPPERSGSLMHKGPIRPASALVEGPKEGPEEQTHRTMRRAELDDRELAERPEEPSGSFSTEVC